MQFNYGYTVDQCRRAVEMIDADALILHLNPLQEAVQPEGDVNWRGLLGKIADVCAQLGKPVIVKEVGWGISAQAARRLIEAGVSAIDVAGAGGTSWSQVEMHRAPTERLRRLAGAFADWGIPTAESLVAADDVRAELGREDVHLFASGGIRTGQDIVKCAALGADLVGLASPFLKAAMESAEAVVEEMEIAHRRSAHRHVLQRRREYRRAARCDSRVVLVKEKQRWRLGMSDMLNPQSLFPHQHRSSPHAQRLFRPLATDPGKRDAHGAGRARYCHRRALRHDALPHGLGRCRFPAGDAARG